MRTTLDLDDDILLAAKEIARRDKTSGGDVVSRLVRQSLVGTGGGDGKPGGRPHRAKPNAAGFTPFPVRPGGVVTNELVNAIRDREGI